MREDSPSPRVTYRAARPDNRTAPDIIERAKALTSADVKAYIHPRDSGAVVTAF